MAPLSQIKGSALACLVALAGQEYPLTIVQIRKMTGYCARTVSAGLRRLADYHLARQVSVGGQGRWPAWQATPQGRTRLRQLTGSLSESSIPSSSSSYSIHPESIGPPSHHSGGGNAQQGHVNGREALADPPLSDEAAEVAELLVRLPQPCPRKRAQAAVRKALRAGDSLEKIEREILRWQTYCRSEAGRSVKAKGFFIASKIENREPCPVRTAEEEGQRICLECGHARAEHSDYGCFKPVCVCRGFEPDDEDWEPGWE